MAKTPHRGPGFAALSLAGGVLIGGAGAAAADFTAAAFVGPLHPVVEGGYEVFINQVAEASDGALSFNMFSAGALLGPRETMSGVRDGVADIGFIVLIYHPAEFPHGALLADMALMAEDVPATSAAVTEIMLLHCEPCMQEFANNGVIPFGAYATTMYNIIGNQPHDTVEALRGQRIRTPGGAWDRWSREFGAVSVNVPASEIYEGLNRGALDAVMLPVSDYDAYNLWDVASHVTMLPVGSFFSNTTFAISPDFWRSIGTENRQIMLDHGAISSMGVTVTYLRQNAEVGDQLEARGINVIEPSAEMTEAFEAFRAADREAVLNNARERGIADPEAFLDLFEQKVAKYQELFAGHEGDHDAMVAIVQREVYDQLDADTFGL